MRVRNLHLSVATNRLALRDVTRTLLVKHLHVSQSSLLEFLGQIDLIWDAQSVPDIPELYTFLSVSSTNGQKHNRVSHPSISVS